MIKEAIEKLAKRKIKTDKNKFDCSNITKPKDITSQCDYRDEFPNGKEDNDLVSCCQSKDDGNNYDELENFYETHFSEKDRKKHGKKILKAMCNCCNKKVKEWKWKNYKSCIENTLNEYGLNARYIEKDDIFKFNVVLFDF